MKWMHSVFNIQNQATRQYFCMNYIACTNFSSSSDFCKTQHVLYFLNAGGSKISIMTFPCVMKAKRISLHICISLRLSSFFFISLHGSAFLCISLPSTAFLWPSIFSLHFSEFLCISLNFSAFLYISAFLCIIRLIFWDNCTELTVVLCTPFFTSVAPSCWTHCQPPCPLDIVQHPITTSSP